MVLEYNCWKQLSTSNGFPQQNGFAIPVRWWWWPTVLMMRLKILETISTAKWFWHSGTVMMTVMMNDGVDERRCWWWDWRFRVWFVLFCFVLFGFIWGCRKQLCWDLCTVHKDFLMHHNRSHTQSGLNGSDWELGLEQFHKLGFWSGLESHLKYK